MFTFCEKRHVALHRHKSVTKWPPEVIGDFPGKDFPENEFPGNDFPENDFPENNFPENDFPENDFPEKCLFLIALAPLIYSAIALLLCNIHALCFI